MKYKIISLILCIYLFGIAAYANEVDEGRGNSSNVQIENEINKMDNELENIMEDTPFNDIIEKSEGIMEKHKDNSTVKFLKKLSDIVFDYLNSILEKAKESILEMINSHEEFKIIE